MARRKVDAPHLTKSGRARQHIQELILSGAVREGQHITAREVCEAVGISETPVREAIRSRTFGPDVSALLQAVRVR